MDFRTVAQAPALRIIFLTHLILTVWYVLQCYASDGNVGDRVLQHNWLPPSYSLYNSLFLVSLLWSLHSRDSEDAIFMTAGTLPYISDFPVMLTTVLYVCSAKHCGYRYGRDFNRNVLRSLNWQSVQHVYVHRQSAAASGYDTRVAPILQ